MSGFRDPYTQGSGGYMGDRYNDTSYNNYDYGAGELFNPYAEQHRYQTHSNPYSNPYEQQPPPPPQQQQTRPYRSNSGEQNSVQRSNTSGSQYSHPSASQHAPPPMEMRDADRTLPGVPQDNEPEEEGNEYPTTGFGGDGPGGNVLRKGTNRLSRANYSGLPLERDVTRQSLTPLTRAPASKSPGDIKKWRHDHHGNLWTRGSRGSCIVRFCCCTIGIGLLLFISIVLALIMWVRPPDVQFTGVQKVQNGSTFEATTDQTFKVNLGFGINVTNPNYFSATFTSIDADIFYPIRNTNVGGGTQKDITFNAHSNKNFTFPFSFVYSKSADPNGDIIQDIANRCGFIDPSTKKDLSINYKITLKVKVLVANVGPSFSGTANFECPLSADDVKPFLGGLGVNIPGLNS